MMVGNRRPCPLWTWAPSARSPGGTCRPWTWLQGKNGSVMPRALWRNRVQRWREWRRATPSWGTPKRRGSWARVPYQRTPCSLGTGRTSGLFLGDKESTWKFPPKCSGVGWELRPLVANAGDEKMRSWWPRSLPSSKCVLEAEVEL